MVLFYLLGAVVLMAVGIVAFLFYLLNKESKNNVAVQAVPITNPAEVVDHSSMIQSMNDYKQKVTELEEELRSISDKGLSQSKEAIDLIDKLTSENNKLKDENARFKADQHEDLDRVESEKEQLKQDNYLLQTQLDSAHLKVSQLQQEAIASQQRLTSELEAAQSSLEQVRREKQMIVETKQANIDEFNQLTRKLKESEGQNVLLSEQIEDINKINDRLTAELAKLNDVNKALQIELNKQRAQASGLEHICENYRLQLAQKEFS